MEIPKEVLFYIFQHLHSPRYLLNCSLVSKTWYDITTYPIFYKAIIIYSPKQLGLFIQMTKNKRHQRKNIGHYVKHLVIQFKDPISNQTMVQLQECCPNLSTICYNIDDSLNQQRKKYELLGYWRQLTHLPTWHKEDRFAIILSNGSKLKQFTFYPTLDDIKAILLLNPINGLHLFKPSTHLKELCLDFSHYPLPFNLDLDYLKIIHFYCPSVVKLTIIHALLYCKLNLKNQYMNYLNNNINKINDNKNRFQELLDQQPHIHSLCFENITIDDPFFFTFITKKYPHLTSLTLKNINFMKNQHHHTEHQTAIKNMLTMDLPYLNQLHVTMNKAQLYWPNDNLLNWLSDHPQQFKHISWPFTIYPTTPANDHDSGIEMNIIEEQKKEMTKKKNIKLNIRHYFPIYQEVPMARFMNHLDTLTLKLPGDPRISFDYLLHNNGGVISTTLTSLTIQPLIINNDNDKDNNIECDQQKHTFYIYNWLDALPSLKKLCVHGMEVCLYKRFSIGHSNKNILIDRSPSSLKELVLYQCSIQSRGSNGFTLLCQFCPQLTILENYQCTLLIDEKEIKQYQSQYYYTLFNSPQSSFHQLIFQDLMIIPNNCTASFHHFDLFVKLTSSHHEHDNYYFASHHQLESKSNLLVNILLYSVDILNFDGQYFIH
ncbi:hypothetical protein BJ944DRAFT_245545 [Cunninghamella echinulata]|nr:hypothetical protein BJ944DRAFT_245545 [Cunninghamella echinulata]